MLIALDEFLSDIVLLSIEKVSILIEDNPLHEAVKSMTITHNYRSSILLISGDCL